MPSVSQQIQSEAAITEISIWIQLVRLRFDGTVQEYLAPRLFKFPPQNLVVQLLQKLTESDSLLRGLSSSQLKVYRRLDENKPEGLIELYESLSTVDEHPEYELPFVVVAVPHQSGKWQCSSKKRVILSNPTRFYSWRGWASLKTGKPVK